MTSALASARGRGIDLGHKLRPHLSNKIKTVFALHGPWQSSGGET